MIDQMSGSPDSGEGCGKRTEIGQRLVDVEDDQRSASTLSHHLAILLPHTARADKELEL
jgi:hypothetical protein